MKRILLNSQRSSRVWSVCLFNGARIVPLLCAEVSPGPHCSRGKVQPSLEAEPTLQGRAACLSFLIGTPALLLTKVQPQGLPSLLPPCLRSSALQSLPVPPSFSFRSVLRSHSLEQASLTMADRGSPCWTFLECLPLVLVAWAGFVLNATPCAGLLSARLLHQDCSGHH